MAETDMNKLLRAQFRGEDRESPEEDEGESIGGKSDAGAGGDTQREVGEEENMNVLIRDGFLGR